MISIKLSTLIIILIIIICTTINITFGTRLPLEVFEIPAHSTNSNSNSNYLRQKSSTSSSSSTSSYHHSDRRRSRQMDEISTPQTQRILYQVGNSEENLPICAPNAVCSKIDLYETPWIERQCRCPDALSTLQKNSGSLILNHPKDYHYGSDQKLRKYLTSENNLQHKRLGNMDDKRFETAHLRRLLQKFGAVYQDDIMLDDNDFHENMDDMNNNAFQSYNKNEFPFANHKDYGVVVNQPQTRNHEVVKKLRHSAHRKDISYIGGCPSNIGVDDGHTIADKTRHYKLCNPVHKLPMCKYFRDYTWTLSSSPEMNVTEQIVHCKCPRNSVTYLTKREPLTTGRMGYTYLFACSPQSRLRCQRKEPCKLFTVRKRQEFLDEVNTNPLCQCPKGHRCPKHHTDSGVIAGKSYIEDNIQTYSGYCMAND